MPIKEQDPELRKKYFRDYATKRRELNRLAVQQYKVEQGCKDCGYNKHHAGLEFDHIGDNKYANVASLMGTTRLLWEEVEKCEVVCGICHNIRSWDRMVAAGKASK